MTKLSIHPFSSRYPFRNLIFQGGGVKSYGYHGVLRVLEEHHILPNIERVGGTSAGAVQATLLSFRKNAEETIELYKSLDLTRVRKHSLAEELPLAESHLLEAQLDKIRGSLNTAKRLFENFGLYSNRYLLTWLEETIAQHCDGNGRATFADFRKHGFCDLYIVAVNVSRHRAETFCAENTPNVSVADAVIMSGSIPFVFEAVHFNGEKIGTEGDVYVDGGLLSNFPINIFDSPKFAINNRNFTYGINWETLGCRLYTPEDCPQRETSITNIFNFAENLIETSAEVYNTTINYRAADRLRIINVSDGCISPIDFDIRTEMSDPQYRQMVEQGQEVTRQYLESYQLPTDRFAGIKDRLTEFMSIWH